MYNHRLTGRWGEALAAEYYRKKHYELVALNYSCRYGEIDVIVRNRRFIVFVEVKLRKSEQFARAADYVDVAKQNRIRTTASLWLSLNETALQPRFDVVEIYAPEGMETRKPKINLIEDAFQ
ncbi:MAG: YraN family protein [Oscillospiraceae bacterium]|jgi:putative endonuclease|nr:YraN family protein [Oscillospiraceae bacterium]